jgi:hypothetical protein
MSTARERHFVMLTLWTILGWSTGIGITLVVCICLLEWIGRRDDRRHQALEEARRQTLEQIVIHPPHPNRAIHFHIDGRRLVQRQAEERRRRQ